MGPVGWLGLARRFLRAMEMWDLETWLVDVGGEGLGLDLEIFEVFSNLNESMVL